jgi:16S rRNA (guanine1207-N2)-methyltransferase
VTVAVYGAPPRALADVAPEAMQLSPLMPGAMSLEALGEGTLSRLVVLAPPGTVERHYTLALGLRALTSDGTLIAMAPKDRGGSRLRKELEALGCTVTETMKSHHRICHTTRPEPITGLEEAIAAGWPRVIQPFGLWSQPGVFSWDRIDPGTALLMQHLPPLAGKGADLGCGIGYLGRAVLTAPEVQRLALIDLDHRAVDCARRNVDDARAAFHWADATGADAPLEKLDFVVMNPPFHGSGWEDRQLGQKFIRRAAAILRKGGSLWIVANRHLPYEAVLGEVFSTVEVKTDQGGYKVVEARR